MKLKDCTLFNNTSIDLSQILVKELPMNYTLELEGDSSDYLGIVLEGKIHVKAYSLAGKNFTINTIYPGMIFGDVLLFGTEAISYPGNLITAEKTILAIIPYIELKEYIFKDPIFLENFLSVLSDKVSRLNAKNKLLSQDSIRDKILFFLYQQKRIQKVNKIKLHMTKEELANDLFIQRPSLSRELMRMKEDGLIDYDRWSITLKI